MKFVNKLSVVSLLVLMFSFMNIATAADQCVGTAVPSCKNMNLYDCGLGTYYQKSDDRSGTPGGQCELVNGLNGPCVIKSGTACCSPGQHIVNGKCTRGGGKGGVGDS